MVSHIKEKSIIRSTISIHRGTGPRSGSQERLPQARDNELRSDRSSQRQRQTQRQGGALSGDPSPRTLAVLSTVGSKGALCPSTKPCFSVSSFAWVCEPVRVPLFCTCQKTQPNLTSAKGNPLIRVMETFRVRGGFRNEGASSSVTKTWLLYISPSHIVFILRLPLRSWQQL